MTTLLSIASVILASFGALIIAMNAFCVVASLRSRWRGIHRFHSTVPLVGPLFLGGATAFIPHWILWSVALADISLWGISLLIRLPFHKDSSSTPNPK